jgi:hypothetical protein
VNNLKVNWAATLAAILIGLAGITVAITSTDNPTPEGGHARTIKFTVDKSGKAGDQNGTVTAPAPVVAAIKPNLESHLLQPPAGSPPSQLDAANALELGIKATLPPLPTGGATAGVPGCRTLFVNNQSSRHGVRPIWFVLHYTVSPNVPGWADVYSVVGLFNRSSSQASSHFVLDAEGHCAYIVPIEAKAWTEAAGNSLSVSVEIIATGRESTLCVGPCLKELRTIYNTVSARTGIARRAGSVYPPRGGCIQHKDGGLSWGGHIDITPFSRAALCAQLNASVKPSKKQVWIKHRIADHRRYVRSCHTAKQRKANAKKCAEIRAHARRLDTLIKRRKA